MPLPDIEIPLGPAQRKEIDLTFDVEPVAQYIENNAPAFGSRLADAWRAAMASVLPVLSIGFKAQGNCNNFPAISISKQSHNIMAPDRLNARIPMVGVGVVGKLTATVDADVSGETTCTLPNNVPGHRKTQTFIIRLSVDVTLSPGPGGPIFIEQYTQLVMTDCCPITVEPEPSIEDPPTETEESGEDGWW